MVFLLSYVGIKDDGFPPLVSSASATSSGAQPSISSAVHTNLIYTGDGHHSSLEFR